MMAKGTIWSIESIKNRLVITFEAIVAYSMITLGAIWLGLMMFYSYIMDNILQCYDYFFKGKLTSSPPSFLIQFYRIARIGLKILKKRLYGLKSHLRWPS